RRQEQNQIRDLFRLADTAQWTSRLAPFNERGVAVFVHARVQMQVRTHDSRIDRVYTHTFGSEFQSGTPRELVDGGFADTVGEDIWKRTQDGDTGKVNDVAFPFND